MHIPCHDLKIYLTSSCTELWNFNKVYSVTVRSKQMLQVGLYFMLPDLTCPHSSHEYVLFCSLINPLTTDDAFWHRQILAVSYQLAQFVLKIGSVLAERVGWGEVGGSTVPPDSAWWRL